MQPRRDALVTLALALVALTVRVGLVLHVPQPPAWDGVLYERAARGLASGLGYTTFMFEHRSSDTVPTAYYPVGYPAFLALAYRVFGMHVRVAQLAGALVSALQVPLAHRLALRAAPPLAALLASLALALLPSHVLFAGALMTEPFVGLMVMVAVWSLVRSAEATPHDGSRRPPPPVSVFHDGSRRPPPPVSVFRDGSRRPPPSVSVFHDGSRAPARWLALAVVALALATYARPQCVLLAPTLPLVAFAHRRLRASVVVTACALALVAPWTVRNCVRLDGCAFVSTNGGSNLAVGAIPRATGEYLPLDAHDGCAGVTGEVARSRCWERVARDAIVAAPVRWIALAPTKLYRTLVTSRFPSGYLHESHATTLDAAGIARVGTVCTYTWLVLFALALVALVPRGRGAPMAPAARTCALAVAVMLAPHAVVFGGDRYHLALIAPCAVLAAALARRRMSAQPFASLPVDVAEK